MSLTVHAIPAANLSGPPHFFIQSGDVHLSVTNWMIVGGHVTLFRGATLIATLRGLSAIEFEEWASNDGYGTDK